MNEPGAISRVDTGERKVISALFADLVGSTSIAEGLDPEDGKAIIDESIRRVIHAVERFGGTVKDIAGDGVLALFGAPAAHEDDAERAVRTALEAIHEISTYAREVEQGWGVSGFNVRVGVATGPVVLGAVGAGNRVEYGAYGDTVNIAARLQGSASPGAVVVSESTRRECEIAFEWSDPFELELKGKKERVTAYEVRGLRSVPRGKASALQTDFIGRQREMTIANEIVNDVMGGVGRLLFINGEAGIGKSRFVSEIRDLVERSPGDLKPVWLEGRCVSYGESMPYWPFRDLFREWLGVHDDEPEVRARVALRRRLGNLFGDRLLEIYPYVGAMLGLVLEPDASDRLASLSPEALQFRTFEVIIMLLERLAENAPIVAVLEDMHWSDPTSIQLTEQLLAATERAALLMIVTHRVERDHASWTLKERAARDLPHRTRELALEALSSQADRDLLRALIGNNSLPEALENRLIADAEGNPFYLEELVRSLADAGVLVQEAGGWRFDHEAPLDLPPTIERVVLARIDRLSSERHQVITAASVLGRRFGLTLLEDVAGAERTRESIAELLRLDLLREGRRWPQPEYRFKHALIQEAAYRTLLTSKRLELHRRAAECLEIQYAGNEDEALGLLAHHWLNAADEDKAIAYLTRAADKARQEYSLDEAIEHYRELLPLLERRGRRTESALVLFKLALALHQSLRFSEANDTYQNAFAHWTTQPGTSESNATLRTATSFLPDDADPTSAIAWPNIQLCMQLFDRLVEAWPERTIVPCLAEWWEISPDGLRYVFRLREGLKWSDGVPLTARDVEYGIKRVLDPVRPGSSVAIYFVIENGQDYYLGHERNPDRIGVRALDDRTVEFRLAAPAPYFMSVMNRPDGGPQPRHAIEKYGNEWTTPEAQVVSGPFRRTRVSQDSVILERRNDYSGSRPGNVKRIEFIRSSLGEAFEPFDRDELDLALVRYTPRIADIAPPRASNLKSAQAAWSAYLAFDHSHPATGEVELRRALAYAIDREALKSILPSNLLLASGGLVPPALQGHTPDIAPRFDPDRARTHLARAQSSAGLQIAALDEWEPMVRVIVDSWKDVLDIEITFKLWTHEEALRIKRVWDVAPIALHGWLPGYPDPEYFLRLLLHSDSKTNEGGFAYPPFDNLIESARQERSDRARLQLFHDADRMAIAEQVALIPIAYGQSMALVKPWVRGWWEFGKSSASFGDLIVDKTSPRATG